LSQGEEIDVSADYIEKIVQLPIKLPELSDIDIKNYMLLLICEMYLKKEKLDILIAKLKEDGFFIKGEIISSVDIKERLKEISTEMYDLVDEKHKASDFENQLDIFSKISDIVSVTLKGNPRQAKRFLNMFYVRKMLSDIQNLQLNLAVLAKLMVLEYVDTNLFKQLYRWQFENQGISPQLGEIENAILNGNSLKPEFKTWEKDAIKRWINTDPSELSKTDLRQYFYLARESVKDENISKLDLGLDERRKINEICKKGLDNTIRRKRIQELEKLLPNKKDEIIKGIISHFNREHVEYFEVLIYIYENCEEYREKIVCEFKKMNKSEMNMPNLLLLKTLQKTNPQQIDELIQFYITNKIINEKLWEKV